MVLHLPAAVSLRLGCAFAAIVLAAVVVASWSPGTAAAAAPTVTIKPTAVGGAYTNGQQVVVAVGPNSLFVPHTRINIIECADPGGKVANLPTSLMGCDSNTVEADSVLVQPDGSFTEPSFTLYALPNATLGEQSNWQPVCNPSHECVLYVGENQNDFTQAKIFSQAFAFTSSAPTNAGGTSTASTATTAPVSAAVTLPAATLAFTGSAGSVLWIAGVGLGLVAAGVVGRRRLTKGSGS